MNTDDEKGYELVRTPGGDQQGFAQAETLEGYTSACTPGGKGAGVTGEVIQAGQGAAECAPQGTRIVSTPVDDDPEDVQFSARTDDGDVVMYLPEITYLDTQQWSVEIGLTPDRLVQLREAIDNHLRGAADHAGPANHGDTPTVATPSGGVAAGSCGDIDMTAADNLSAAKGSRGDTPTTVLQPTTVEQTLARVSAAVDTPSGPLEEPTSEYGIGWDTAMDLVRAAIEEQP
ncbi:hypothetical protein [Streptomyces cyaneofuscatus]|uniref:hypothetical protein n=1 Tax=Streptomyces cyaneofuscatus TaxID=66883 RepID=UPI0037B1410E